MPKLHVHLSVNINKNDISNKCNFSLDVNKQINDLLPEWAKVVKTRKGTIDLYTYFVSVTLLVDMEDKHYFEYQLSKDIPSKVSILKTILEGSGITGDYEWKYKIKEL